MRLLQQPLECNETAVQAKIDSGFFTGTDNFDPTLRRNRGHLRFFEIRRRKSRQSSDRIGESFQQKSLQFRIR